MRGSGSILHSCPGGEREGGGTSCPEGCEGGVCLPCAAYWGV